MLSPLTGLRRPVRTEDELRQQQRDDSDRQEDDDQGQQEDYTSAADRSHQSRVRAPPRMSVPTGRTIEFDTLPPQLRSNPRRSTFWSEISNRAYTQARRSTGPNLDGFGGLADESRERYTSQANLEDQRHGLQGSDDEFFNELTIDGATLTLRDEPHEGQFKEARLWNKLERASLAADVKLTFSKHATGYVLSKSNKLAEPVISNEDGKLNHIHNLQAQLKTLRHHMVNYDIMDVFHIVIPKDVQKTSALVDKDLIYDLFLHHSKLTPNMVANSCEWYNRRVQQDFVRENMNLTLQCLQNNTEESLWIKCYSVYEDEYSMEQRGGPLMLSLLLKKIQDSSESAMEHLKASVHHLKISDLKGEDVDLAVGRIKSAYNILSSASTPDHCYIPDDFPKTVLTVLQTSSVPEFNHAFKAELDEIQRQSDKFGGLPQWPTVSELTTLATNTYQRLLNANQWHVAATTKSKGYNVTPRTGPSSSNSRKVACFNCGSPDHLAPDCPQPRDEAKITANREKYQRQNGNNSRNQRPRGRGKPKHKTAADGTPQIRNKLGAWVPDQKKIQNKAKLASIADSLAALHQSGQSSSQDSAPETTKPPAPSKDAQAYRASILKALAPLGS